MQKNFELETILTGVTGVRCVDDLAKYYEMVEFIINDPLIPALGERVVKQTVRDHLLELHPQLEGTRYDGKRFNEWMNHQKSEYGETLPVCPLGSQLKAAKQKTKRR